MVKSLNKAILYCEQNARAYLVRAKLNEGKNNKLAENDYSAAIEYDPNLP
jgi:Tfp pilus assembly protein PilF